MHGESSQVGNDARLPPCVHFPTRIGQDCWDSLGTVLSENVMTVSLSPPSDLPSPNVDVLDFGLSDHCLLRWSTQTYRPAPVFTTSTRRCWRSFDQDTFRSDLLASVLCDPQVFTDLDCLDCDSFASLYDSTISELLNRQVPVRSVSCRQRPSSKWFDDDCRTAKRKLRSLKRAARRDGPLSAATSTTAASWHAERRAYFDLLRRKQREYWTERVDADQSHPCRLWRSFLALFPENCPSLPQSIDSHLNVVSFDPT